MSKYQPLSERLAGHEGPEWQASFAEIEEVLGFPLPRGARTGRAWWTDAEKAHAKSWGRHGFQAHVDPSAARVTFRRSDIAPAAVAAVLPPVGEIAPQTVEAEPAPPIPVLPSATTPAGAEGRSAPLAAAALVAAGLAVIAGLGALVVRAVGRRA